MKTWEKTREQNLVRHKSGRYYARTFNNNKEIWKSLRTAHFSVAKARLAEFLREHREKQVAGVSEASAKMTFGEALKIHLQNQADDVTIKPSTRHYWKQLTLPSREQFLQLVEAVERAGAWCSRDCADLLRGLAFIGCRKGEAAQIEWRDVDFEAGEIVVRGDPETGTKNWTVRRVPMIPDARALFERMRGKRASEPLTQKVFRVREAQRAIDRAARKLGMTRIVHHDLRHLFATIC